MMARSALNTGGRALNRGPRPFADHVPTASVLIGSAVALLPIVTTNGWWPDFGLLMLLSWRLLRADAWPAWWAAPLGFVNDLITGSPIGLSVTLWSAMMLAMDTLDRRTQFRDYRLEWMIAAAFVVLAEAAQWKAAAILGARVPFDLSTGPAILFSILCFPLTAWLVARLDRWRLGR